MLRFVAIISLFLISGPQAFALTESEEQRAEALFSELRCVVCQNQSIADSDAAVASDLRTIVRDKIAAGASDREIIEFLVSRYGEFVLLRPPFDMRTLLLWGAPVFLLGIGGLILWRGRRASGPLIETQLSAEEEARLNRFLNRK